MLVVGGPVLVVGGAVVVVGTEGTVLLVVVGVEPRSGKFLFARTNCPVLVLRLPHPFAPLV